MARILVADDMPQIRELFREMLEAEGHEVVEACDGAQCLALLEQQPVDLAVVDLIMPGTDGIQAIRHIRTRHGGIKLVAMTAGDDSLPAEMGLSLSSMYRADALLRKPFANDVLLRAVRDLLA